MKFKNKTKGLMAYILMPLAFLIIGYSVIYFALSPFIEAVISVWDMVQLSGTINEEDESLYNGSSVLGGTVKSSTITFPNYGTEYARLSIPSAEINAPIFFGDGQKQLSKGIGHYNGSDFPGMGSTILLSGHNNTYLHTIDRAQIGDNITITTSYGVYVYKINEIKIVDSSNVSATNISADEENLVIYTCYPLSTLGLTSKRYFVYAEYVSGPVIIINE